MALCKRWFWEDQKNVILQWKFNQSASNEAELEKCWKAQAFFYREWKMTSKPHLVGFSSTNAMKTQMRKNNSPRIHSLERAENKRKWFWTNSPENVSTILRFYFNNTFVISLESRQMLHEFWLLCIFMIKFEYDKSIMNCQVDKFFSFYESA